LVYLTLCWFCSVWMPLFLPTEKADASLAVSVYGMLIVLLGISESRAVRRQKRQVGVSWMGLIPVWVGYGMSVFQVMG